jgi:Flp pilus assembly protein protease CpaA
VKAAFVGSLFAAAALALAFALLLFAFGNLGVRHVKTEQLDRVIETQRF